MRPSVVAAAICGAAACDTGRCTWLGSPAHPTIAAATATAAARPASVPAIHCCSRRAIVMADSGAVSQSLGSGYAPSSVAICAAAMLIVSTKTRRAAPMSSKKWVMVCSVCFGLGSGYAPSSVAI